MGYDFRIGELLAEGEPEEDCFNWFVQTVRHPNAPTFTGDELTGSSNYRSTTYSGWESAIREAGLYDHFYKPNYGLICRHPGYKVLSAYDLQVIKAARKAYQKKCALPPGFEEGQDSVLAVLIWMEFWIDWALEHCHQPVFLNK